MTHANLDDRISAHWLAPIKRSKRPYTFAALGHTGVWHEYNDSALGKHLTDARQYVLSDWYTLSIGVNSDDVQSDSTLDKASVAALWAALMRRSVKCHNLVVVANNVWPLLSAINTWKMVDADILTLTSPRSKKPQDGRHIYITYGNPTIVTVWLKTSKSKITFADVGNWALTVDATVDSQTQAAYIERSLRSLEFLAMGLGCSRLELSASGIGYRLFRERYVKPKSILVHRDRRVIELERAAYYAGRCEAMGTGTVRGPVYKVDVRSAYAWHAMTKQVPIKLVDYHEATGEPAMDAIPEPYNCIADVVIDSKERLAPLRVDGHIVYPTGMYRTILAGPELSFAYSLGIVRGYKAYAAYKVDYALSEWAKALLDALTSARTAIDKQLSATIKLAINAGIGRMGARWRRWLPGGDGPPDWRWGQWLVKHPSKEYFTFGRAIAGNRYYQDDSLAWPDAVIAIPAWIASAQRVFQYQLTQIAGYGNVYYMDTDSLWTNQVGYDALRSCCRWSDTEPGSLHLEATHDTVSIAGPKVYKADGIWTVPSIDANSWANMFVGEPIMRNYGLADSLHRRKPPEGLARIRRVRVRCCSEDRLNGPWRWTKPINLAIPDF